MFKAILLTTLLSIFPLQESVSSEHFEQRILSDIDNIEKCLSTGEHGRGAWRYFSNGCADHCGAGDVCTAALTYSCDCGEGRCWDAEDKECVEE